MWQEIIQISLQHPLLSFFILMILGFICISMFDGNISGIFAVTCFMTAIIFLGIAAGNGLNYCKYAVAETKMIQQIQGEAFMEKSGLNEVKIALNNFKFY